MSRRTVLITGGTGALGFRAAREIVADGDWRVIVTGRSVAGAAQAAERLGERAEGRALDLSSLADVRRFAGELPPLDGLVACAGALIVSGDRFTQDGVEVTFGVNHLAHFLLIREVLPRMRPGARVVFLSSGTHDPARRTGFPDARYTNAAELAHPIPVDENPLVTGRRRYTTAKLCAVLSAYEFARRVPAEQASFTAFDPGQVPGTGMIRDHRGIRVFAWNRIMPLLARIPGVPMNTVDRAGTALAGMILDPALEGVTGVYVSEGERTRSSRDSYDLEKAADLWETSVALTAPA